MLFVSSTSVYASGNQTATEADGALSGASPLLAIENLFAENAGFSTTIVRFAGLIGYSRHPGRFFRSGKPVQNPNAPVNLIHRDDCIGMNYADFMEPENVDEIFSIFNGIYTSGMPSEIFNWRFRQQKGTATGPQRFPY